MDRLFNWSDVFLTGIDSVDAQHHRLVDLINNLAACVFDAGNDGNAELAETREALADYARVHFADEELLMQQAGMDSRFIDAQKAEHQTFTEEMGSLGPDLSEEALQANLKYLVSWLAHHILGIDQSMARQLQEIRKGASAAEAYEAEQSRRRSLDDPLLDALSVMLHVVSQRNRELRIANAELEARVLERTEELKRVNQQLELLAVNDDLTGLPNRRFAVTALRELWQESRSDGSPLAVLMVDADKFKQVNDTWGHAEGDNLLRELARQLRHAVRTSDIVCRLGGDEFLVICPRSNLQGARLLADKLLAEIKPYRNADGDEYWSGAISIGTAELQDAMELPEDLLKAADLALYSAKRAGGQRRA